MVDLAAIFQTLSERRELGARPPFSVTLPPSTMPDVPQVEDPPLLASLENNTHLLLKLVRGSPWLHRMGEISGNQITS